MARNFSKGFELIHSLFTAACTGIWKVEVGHTREYLPVMWTHAGYYPPDLKAARRAGGSRHGNQGPRSWQIPAQSVHAQNARTQFISCLQNTSVPGTVLMTLETKMDKQDFPLEGLRI